MKAIKADPEIVNLLIQEGKDIFASANMQKEKIFPMHGGVSTFEHSISVAYYAIYLAKKKTRKSTPAASFAERSSTTFSFMTGMSTPNGTSSTVSGMRVGRIRMLKRNSTSMKSKRTSSLNICSRSISAFRNIRKAF